MKLFFMDSDYEIRFIKGIYQNNGNLYLGVENLDEEEGWSSFCDITVNFSEKCLNGCGFLKVTDLPREVYALIRPHIKETGRVMDNGYVSYPEVRFDKEFLDSIPEIL